MNYPRFFRGSSLPHLTINNDLKSSDFKAEIEKKRNEIMKSNKLSETVVFFW